MHVHRGMQRLGQLLVAVTALTCAEAWAEHTAEEQITNSTAYTLRDGEWSVGLWKVEYGLLDRVDIGTFTFPWFVQVPSVIGKYEWYRGEEWSIANRLGVLQVDFANFGGSDETNAVFTVVPIETAVSYRINNDFTLSAEGIFTSISLEGNYNEDDFEGAVAVTNFQWTSTLEYRLSEATAVYGHLRSLAFQDTSGSGVVTTNPDPYTTVELHSTGETDALNVQGASSWLVGLHFAWSTFNLRMGGGYGNFNVPVVNFVIPTKTVILDFDMFWRW